jgi:adenine-specific DNA-methyltransferase
MVSLIEAADRVDSTTGLQMAYLKQWAPRASNNLEMRMPALLERAKAGKGKALQMDALDAAEMVDVDLTYVDPPYNQHSYLANYHIWESLVLWDKPDVYGVACKRVDVRDRKSAFNSKKSAREIFSKTLKTLKSRYLVVSFSNEGFHSSEDLVKLLNEVGELRVIEVDFKRYVGAQIGIYNPSGERVGEVSHLRNKEYLFVVGRDGLPDTLQIESYQQSSLFD